MDIRQFNLPAGIGLTHVKIYDTPGPDGLISGGPHIHLVSAEIYVVLRGTGQVEMLSMKGIETLELAPNQAVYFRPGTFHRTLNPNRDLEILAVMQNGGLPERGDFVMSFPHEILTNPAAYVKAIRAVTPADAQNRRDLSVQGYLQIRDAFVRSKAEGQEALRKFYRLARNLILPKVDGFEWVLKIGAQSELKASLDACDFLRSGRLDYLEASEHGGINPMAEAGRPGMTGELHEYAMDEKFLSDGKRVA